MNSKEIVKHVRSWFGKEMSPGQVFDDLLFVRQQGVSWEDVTNAIRSESDALDEADPEERVIGRNRPAPNNRPAPPPAPPVPGEKKAFCNPRLSFGKYAGKTLLQVLEINPGYVKKLAAGECESGEVAQFWIIQAKLAQFQAAASAPGYKDTDSTGFLV